MKLVIPLVPFASHQGGTTHDVFQIPPNVSKGIFYLFANTAARTGSTPAFAIRAQGASRNVATWFTSVRCYRTPTSPVGLGHFATFPSITTGVLHTKFADWIPPYVRVIHSSTGTAPVVIKWGLDFVCIED